MLVPAERVLPELLELLRVLVLVLRVLVAAGVRVVLAVPEVRTRVVVVPGSAFACAALERLLFACCGWLPVRVGCDVVLLDDVAGCGVDVRLGCVALVLRVLVAVVLRVLVPVLAPVLVLRVLVALVLRVAVVVRVAPDCSTACCNWWAFVTRVAVWLPAGTYVAVVRRENDCSGCCCA